MYSIAEEGAFALRHEGNFKIDHLWLPKFWYIISKMTVIFMWYLVATKTYQWKWISESTRIKCSDYKWRNDAQLQTKRVFGGTNEIQTSRDGQAHGNSVITYFCFHLATFLEEEVGGKMLKELAEIAVKTNQCAKSSTELTSEQHNALLLHGKTLWNRTKEILHIHFL